MANAPRDNNFVPTLLATLNTDGATLIPVKADATTHGLSVDDASTGSDNGPTVAPRDENFIPALTAVSSADGVTPIVVYANSDGKLLVDSN